MYVGCTGRRRYIYEKRKTYIGDGEFPTGGPDGGPDGFPDGAQFVKDFVTFLVQSVADEENIFLRKK